MRRRISHEAQDTGERWKMGTALRLFRNLSWDCLSGASIVGVCAAGTSLAAIDYQAVGEIIGRKGYGHFIAQQDFNPEP